MSLTLNLRNGKVFIPKDYYDRYLSNIDWFFSGLINNTNDDEPIILWEDKEVVLTIFDSLKFNKLTLHENVSLEYLENICNMWCVPEWLLDAIALRKQNIEICKKDSKLNSYIFECKNCGVGFKLSDNTNKSCNTHNYSMISLNGGIFPCCGRSKDDEPCLVGYHIPKDFLYIKNKLL